MPLEQIWLAVQALPQVPQVVVVVLAMQDPLQQVLPVPQAVLFGAVAKPQSPPEEQVATWQEPAAGCGQLPGPVHGSMQPWIGWTTWPGGQLATPVQKVGGWQRLLTIVFVMEL